MPLEEYSNNESVLGFFIEKAILRTIEHHGLQTVDGISRGMTAIPFEGMPNFDTSKDVVLLYVPCKFNHHAIDGVILRLETGGEKGKAFLFPLQITIAKSHKNSATSFFNHRKEWKAGLQDFDVEVTFLRITPEESSDTNVGENSRSLKQKEVLIHPRQNERNIHLRDVNMDIWNRYEVARKKSPKDSGVHT
jgi:hypothetical protein